MYLYISSTLLKDGITKIAERNFQHWKEVKHKVVSVSYSDLHRWLTAVYWNWGASNRSRTFQSCLYGRERCCWRMVSVPKLKSRDSVMYGSVNAFRDVVTGAFNCVRSCSRHGELSKQHLVVWKGRDHKGKLKLLEYIAIFLQNNKQRVDYQTKIYNGELSLFWNENERVAIEINLPSGRVSLCPLFCFCYVALVSGLSNM